MATDPVSKEIEKYQEQIEFQKEQNRMLLQFLEETKASREFLQKQLELQQEREKLALLREQRDYQRILELEKKIELLMPPDPREVHSFESEKATLDIVEDEFFTATGEEEPEIKITLNESGNVSEQKRSSHENNTWPPGKIEGTKPPTASSLKNWDHPSEKFSGPKIFIVEEEPIVPEESKVEEKPTVPEESKEEAKATEPATSHPDSQQQSFPMNPNFLVNKYFDLGLAEAEKNNLAAAIEAFTRVTTLLPNAAPSFLNLAILNFRIGNYSKASQFCQEAVERGSKPAIRLLPKIEAEVSKSTTTS